MILGGYPGPDHEDGPNESSRDLMDESTLLVAACFIAGSIRWASDWERSVSRGIPVARITLAPLQDGAERMASRRCTLVAAGEPMFAAIRSAFEQTGPTTASPSTGILDSRFVSLMSSILFSTRIACAVQGTANIASSSVDVSRGFPAAEDISAAFS